MPEADERFFIREWTRPYPLPPPGVACGLLEVGHYASPAGDLYPEEVARFAAISWVKEGGLILRTESRDLIAGPGTAAVLAPGTRFSTACRGAYTEFHYLAIDGSGAEGAIAENGLWEGVFPCLNIPVKWLAHLAAEINHLERQATLASLAQGVFALLHSEAERAATDKLVWKAECIFQKEWNDPGLNVKRLLERLEVSRSTLCPRFKRMTGVSPQAYLGQIRYRHALNLLRGSSLNCAQVAFACGFSDPNYFSRWFAQKHGATPMSLGRRR